MYLLIVSGLSGAGKSLALRSLEEQGFFCVDNLPSSLLSGFVKLCGDAYPPMKKIAVTVDSRESLLSRSAEAVAADIDALGAPHELLFLDARDDVLLKRYNELRRRHPLGDAGDALTGVTRERKYLESLRTRADYVLDTSDISPRALPGMIEKLLPAGDTPDMTLLISSFGYKRGVPVDADVVLDMRFLPNPFYISSLRHLSGLDKPVADYVFGHPAARAFLDMTESSLKKLLPLYMEQGKHIMRVCFGCSGGRHRSVAAAEELARRLRGQGLALRVYHRDLAVEAADILARERR